jgi:uncharacterized protein YecE (DUF72 family)
MLYLAGTSGFSYKPWVGRFYPRKIAAGDMLRFYGQRLPACEIDNTFYRMPRADVLAGWAAQVPEDFRFTIKASRRITHFKRLKDTAEETGYLLKVVQELGSRLGALLFQLPPNLKKDTDRLARFLDLLPAETPAAFEFREAGWFDDASRRPPVRRCPPPPVGDTCGCDGRPTTTPRWRTGGAASPRPAGTGPASSSSTRTRARRP